MNFYQDKMWMCCELSLTFEDTGDIVIQDFELREMVTFALSRCYVNEDELLKDFMDGCEANCFITAWGLQIHKHKCICARKQELFMLLKMYGNCFAKKLAEWLCIRVLYMEIHEIEGSMSVKCKAYKTSRAERKALWKLVSEWKKTRIASEIRLPYASSVILLS